METYTKWIESQPRWTKVLLCIWFLDITWAIWRICKAVEHNNIVELILAILWILGSVSVLWILDLVWVILFDRPFWFK